MAEQETYIGDGIYASFDGWQIRLRTPRGMEDHEVFLEPGVWASLVEYVKSLNRADAESVLLESQAASAPPEPLTDEQITEICERAWDEAEYDTRIGNEAAETEWTRYGAKCVRGALAALGARGK